MKVAQLLESRRDNWRQLEALCAEMESRRKRRANARRISRFAALYRAACADLALADAYQLPPGTVQYLHQLVGRAHNQLYRSRMFDLIGWAEQLFIHVPRQLYRDGALRLSFALFWGLFLAGVFLASDVSPAPQFAEDLVGKETLESYEQMHQSSISRDSGPSGFESGAAGFYIWHNTSIGLQCFAFGLLFGAGGLFALASNAVQIGAVFGFMAHSSASENFFEFVTAHGPFELTAIVLSAAAGMRLGFSLVKTNGLTRADSLRLAARKAMPAMGAAMLLFGLAALIEGFISPSSLPYELKASIAGVSCCLLLFYFVVLGYPEPNEDALAWMNAA